MLGPTNPNPIAYDYLASIVAPDVEYTPENVAQVAKDFINNLQDAPDLASHRALQGRDSSEIDLVRRIVEYYKPEEKDPKNATQAGKDANQNFSKDPDVRMDLDGECRVQFRIQGRRDLTERVRKDGRFLATCKYEFEHLVAADQGVLRILDLSAWMMQFVTKDDPEHIEEWREWFSNFHRCLPMKVFQVYWMRAMEAQQTSGDRYLLNLDRFIEVDDVFRAILKSYQLLQSTFTNTKETRNAWLQQLTSTLQFLFPRVCPELHQREIQVIVQSFRRFWDTIGSKVDASVRVGMCVLIKHLDEVAQGVIDDACAAHLVGLIYQMRNIRATDACINRRLHEWHELMMLYWNHAFRDNAACRMDWIAMRWKQDFLIEQVRQLLLERAKGAPYPAGIELEIYRANQIALDPILHFGMASVKIAYQFHEQKSTLRQPAILFGALFNELRNLMQDNAKGWVDYALMHCPSTRIEYGMYYTNELLKSRFQCWLSGDLQPLCSSTKDASTTSHVQSLRYLLAPYRSHSSYEDTESKILQHLSALQDETTAYDQQPVISNQIIDLALSLNESYEQEQIMKAREPLLQEALKAGVLRHNPNASKDSQAVETQSTSVMTQPANAAHVVPEIAVHQELDTSRTCEMALKSGIDCVAIRSVSAESLTVPNACVRQKIGVAYKRLKVKLAGTVVRSRSAESVIVPKPQCIESHSNAIYAASVL